MEKRQREEVERWTVMYKCAGAVRHSEYSDGVTPKCVPCMELERTVWHKAMRESRMPNVVSVSGRITFSQTIWVWVCIWESDGWRERERMKRVRQKYEAKEWNKRKIMRGGDVCVFVWVCVARVHVNVCVYQILQVSVWSVSDFMWILNVDENQGFRF